MYRLFDHTADVGFHVEAESLSELLREAGRALMSLVVDDPAGFDPAGREEVELRADRTDDLLFDYLSELLYLFATRGFVAVEQEIETDGKRLRATVRGDRFDPDRHRGGTEVKAITYHGLAVERSDDGYVAQVIVDV